MKFTLFSDFKCYLHSIEGINFWLFFEVFAIHGVTVLRHSGKLSRGILCVTNIEYLKTKEKVPCSGRGTGATACISITSPASP